MPPRFASYLRDFLSENGGPGELPETPNVYVSVVNLKDQVLLQRAYAKAACTSLEEPDDDDIDQYLDPETLRELDEIAALGLPTGFASNPATSNAKAKKKKRRAANTGQDAAAVLNASVVAPGAASGQQPPAPSPTDWVQAYDASSGHFYYYCSALQLTQWEAPEAFVPLDLRGWPPFEGTHTRFDDEGRPLQSSADTPEASTSGHRGASDTTGAFAGARAPCAPAVPSWRQERTDACCSEEHGTTGASALQASASPGRGNRKGGASGGRAEAVRADGCAYEALSPEEVAVALAAGCDTDMHKYWRGPVRGHPQPQHRWQRFRFFSRFDSGCALDREGWFSVTPEAIARHQARRCAGLTVVDAFAGVGGNVVQFAHACPHVVAVEINPGRLDLCRHNARVYGVDDRVEFLAGDSLEFLRRGDLRGDVLFLSPPWGGPDYLLAEVFDLTMPVVSGHSCADLIRLGMASFRGVIVFLPRNIHPDQVAEAVEGAECEVECNFLNTKLKTVTLYIGEGFTSS